VVPVAGTSLLKVGMVVRFDQGRHPASGMIVDTRWRLGREESDVDGDSRPASGWNGTLRARTLESTQRSRCLHLDGMVHCADLLEDVPKLSSDVELPLPVEPEFVQRVQLVGYSTRFT
jgi:hypothetical protein